MTNNSSSELKLAKNNNKKVFWSQLHFDINSWHFISSHDARTERTKREPFTTSQARAIMKRLQVKLRRMTWFYDMIEWHDRMDDVCGDKSDFFCLFYVLNILLIILVHHHHRRRRSRRHHHHHHHRHRYHLFISDGCKNIKKIIN